MGYFSPYFTQTGVSLAYAQALRGPGGLGNGAHRLLWLTELSFFSQRQVAQQLLLNPALAYHWHPGAQPFYLSAALGSAYQGARQRQSGSLNLATGEMSYTHAWRHAFVPNLQLGAGMSGAGRLGGYLKITYGSQRGWENAPAPFLALTAGISYKTNP